MSENQVENPVVRTSIGLRDALFDEIDALKAGNSNPSRASAMSKLAVQIINSAKMEAQFQQYCTSTTGSRIVASKPVQLGTDVC